MNAPTGPTGPAGAAGAAGAVGATGPTGPTGATPTVTVAATNTGAPGSTASVTAANTATGVALTFTVPQGPTGPVGPAGAAGVNGAVGATGPAGATPTVEVAATNTGAPGSAASVTAANTATGVALTFTVPQGPTGPAGPVGPAGNEGPIGATPTVEVAATNTGDPGTNAEVSSANTPTGVELTFTIPQGPTGPTGAEGATPTVTVAATNTGDPGTDASVTAADTGTGVALTFTIPRGTPGGNITENNALLTYNDSQTVTAGNPVVFADRAFNPATGSSIAASGTTGVTLEAGKYLVTFVSDAGVTGAGSIAATLQLDGAPISNAVETSLAQSGAATERITLNAIVTSTGGQTLTVVNNGGDENTHANTVMTVVQLS